MALGDLHHRTPAKARILGTVAYLQDYKIPFFKEDVFRQFGASHASGWEILRQGRERRHFEGPDPRGRKKLLSPAELRTIEETIWKSGFQARALSWEGLALQAGIDKQVSTWTIKRAMGTLDYRKCIACEKGWVSPACAKRRIHDAQIALQYRPRPEDWHDIRWSDEVHFSICSEGRIRIIRKRGERYCPDCIHHPDDDEQTSVNTRRYHAWGAVGWNFKSDLYFYEVPTNINGKMSLQIYHDEILEKAVGPWLASGQNFVLEEDGDSGHGTGRKSNIVKTWKEEHHLKHYFNTPGSPDLAPIENCWRDVKQYIRANRRLGADLQQLALAGWRRIDQETINKRVDSMVVRMQDVLASQGKMTGW